MHLIALAHHLHWFQLELRSNHFPLDYTSARLSPNEIKESKLWKDLYPVLDLLQNLYDNGENLQEITIKHLHKWTYSEERISIWV